MSTKTFTTGNPNLTIGSVIPVSGKPHPSTLLGNIPQPAPAPFNTTTLPTGTQPYTMVETITPQIAEQYLSTNVANQRQVKKRVVANFARDMQRGKWQLNMQPIAFDQAGQLIDGQHRLLACIKAGVPFQTAVSRGVQNEAFYTFDVGAPRTVKNLLEIEGVQDRAHIASAARILHAYEQHAMGVIDFHTAMHSGLLSRTEQLEFINQRLTELQAANLAITSKRVLKGLLPLSWANVLFVIFHRIDVVLAESFFETLASGANLRENDPIYVLRQRLVSMAASRTRSEYMHEILAMTIKTWNRVRKGEKAKILVYKPNSGESFPIAE